jgi:hypothetical protein
LICHTVNMPIPSFIDKNLERHVMFYSISIVSLSHPFHGRAIFPCIEENTMTAISNTCLIIIHVYNLTHCSVPGYSGRSRSKSLWS